MSEVNLLIFGCVVSFIAVAGVYVYLRERFEAAERSSVSASRVEAVAERALRDVA